jgi:opacity protein-like surface antigen
VNGQDYWGVSMLASANMTDAVHAEIGFGHKNYDSKANDGWTVNPDTTAALAGIYYDPVSQLTIGLEGEYINPKGSKNNTVSVDLVTVYRF